MNPGVIFVDTPLPVGSTFSVGWFDEVFGHVSNAQERKGTTMAAKRKAKRKVRRTKRKVRRVVRKVRRKVRRAKRKVRRVKRKVTRAKRKVRRRRVKRAVAAAAPEM